MAAVTNPTLRKLLSLGNGVGVCVEERDLLAVAVRVRPQGIGLAGARVIEDFRNRPAGEWGAEYQKFLESAGMSRAGALVLLPRHEIVVRTLVLPGVTDQDAPNALRFQLDGLHPYDEDEIVYDWQRLGRTASFVVAVARREVIEQYTALFSEAGVALAGFTYSAGAIFRAARILQQPPAELIAVAGLHADASLPVEIYGESAAIPLLSGAFELGLDRVIPLAKSQLRLPDDAEPVDLADLLPRWSNSPEGMDLSDSARSQWAVAYSAALAAACPHLGEPVNLLPKELRRGVARGVYIPTAALALILLALGGALMLQNRWLEKAYVKRLDVEIQKLEPTVARTQALDRASAQLLQQIRDLDAFRSASRRDLDLMLDLTRTIEAPGYLQQLNINASAVNLAGEIDQAEGLLKRLETSPLLKNPEFTAPLQRNPTNQNEMFRLKADREAGR